LTEKTFSERSFPAAEKSYWQSEERREKEVVPV